MDKLNQVPVRGRNEGHVVDLRSQIASPGSLKINTREMIDS